MQECLLRELPKVLLGRVWPEHRVLMGLRVCKWLQADLQSHAAGALLIVIFQEATILDRIRATLRRLRGCKIYLDGQMLCPPQTDEIFSGIAGIAGQQPAMLVHLDLRKADVGCTEPGLLNVLNVCTALEFLDLSDAGNVEKQWSDVFKSLGKTKGLKHLGGTFIDDGSAASLKALLTETSNLTSLNMDRTGFDSILIEGISQAMARHTSLTRLNVRFVEMGASNASELCGMLRNQKRLHHLDMDAIEMGNEGAEKLCETLAGCSELRFLDVGVNSIQGATACRLGMSLASLSRLASLSVSGNAFGDAGIRCLCSAVAGSVPSAVRCYAQVLTEDMLLPGFQSLTALNLRQTALGAEACSPDCLGAVLRQCPKLLRLDVTWNEAIGDQGALALAASLRESRSLMDLDSAWCGIGTDGARALVAALVATPTIVVADMQMNRIPLPEAKRLDAASRAIEGGRDFTLRILAQTKVPDPAAAAR